MEKEAYQFFDDITRLGNKAVRKAQDKNTKLGIPNVYSTSDGKMFFKLPDGTLTTINPFD